MGSKQYHLSRGYKFDIDRHSENRNVREPLARLHKYLVRDNGFERFHHDHYQAAYFREGIAIVISVGHDYKGRHQHTDIRLDIMSNQPGFIDDLAGSFDLMTRRESLDEFFYNKKPKKSKKKK